MEPKMKMAPAQLYICDPEKNVTCSKKFCFLTGGPCFCTLRLKCARQPVVKVKRRMLSPEEAQRLRETGSI